MLRTRIAAAIFVATAGFSAFPAVAHAATGGDTSKLPGHCSAYRWADADSGTICGEFPGDKDRDCPEIVKPVTLRFGPHVDPWKLDDIGIGNGIGCETPTSPSPSTSQSSSASPSPSTTSKPPTTQPTTPPATATATETADSTPTAAPAVDNGPTLPKTGMPIGPVALVAGIIVVLGLCALIWVRRRTPRFESD